MKSNQNLEKEANINLKDLIIIDYKYSFIYSVQNLNTLYS